MLLLPPDASAFKWPWEDDKFDREVKLQTKQMRVEDMRKDVAEKEKVIKAVTLERDKSLRNLDKAHAEYLQVRTRVGFKKLDDESLQSEKEKQDLKAGLEKRENLREEVRLLNEKLSALNAELADARRTLAKSEHESKKYERKAERANCKDDPEECSDSESAK